MSILFYVSCQLHLSLERFYSKGLNPSRAKEIIEQMIDPGGSGVHLHCEPSSCNNNWIVNTLCTHPADHSHICEDIEDALERELRLRT